MTFVVTMTSTFVCTAVVLITALPVASAQKFLDVEPDFVNQLQSMMGHSQNIERMEGMKGELRSTYMALPQDARGSLDHRAARYALYRYFLVERGWHIKGLSLDVDEHDVSPATVLKSRMPALIMELLEKQLGSDRVALEDLALMATTIEGLVDGDAVDLLEMSYSTYGFGIDESLSTWMASRVIRTFVLYFLLPSSHQFKDDRAFIRKLADGDAGKFFTGWDDTALWAEDLKESQEYHDRIASHPFAAVAGHRLEFSSVVRWAMAISARSGEVMGQECQKMKHKMLHLEDTQRNDGRVGLAKFYADFKAGGGWHFSESPAYLRHLGALDEHDSRRPSVIVPNWLYSKANCLSTFGFHSLCCADECEVLMAELEQRTLRPAAAPALIAAIVSAMPSDTIAAPRNLSAQLLSRLDDLAGRHGGTVPLHSRLFAQWMHYAFPTECPFPRSLLTSEAQLPSEDWEDKHNVTSDATKEEMEEVTKLMNTSHTEASEISVVPWSEDEELLSDRPSSGMALSVLRVVALAVVCVASASAMLGAARVSLGESFESGGGKHSGVPPLGMGGLAGESSSRFV